MIKRRNLLTGAAGVATAAALGDATTVSAQSTATSIDPLIAQTSSNYVFASVPGSGEAWGLTKATAAPQASGNAAIFMCMTPTRYADDEYDAYWTQSLNKGITWTAPVNIPGYERILQPDGQYELAHIDACPLYHPPTNQVIVTAYDYYYRTEGSTAPQPPRFSRYVIRRPDGTWTDPQVFDLQDPNQQDISCSGSQPLFLPNGNIITPLSYRPLDHDERRVVTTAIWSFDGDTLTLVDRGDDLEYPVGQGLYEPNIATTDYETFYLAIRADDQHGYVTRSVDGLHWDPMLPWTFDDGTDVVINRTQQHWFAHSSGLFLVYYRKSDTNANVGRYRTPTYISRFDPTTMRLVRSTEIAILPQRGDGSDIATTYRGGNPSTTPIGPFESIIADGQYNYTNFEGSVGIGEVRWTQRNDLWDTVS